MIAFYFVDLNPDLPYMQTAQTFGSAPSRYSIIRYQQVPVCPFGQDATHNDTSNDTAVLAEQPSISADVVLFEVDAHIEVRYYTIVQTSWPIVVGVQDGMGDGGSNTAAINHVTLTAPMISGLVNTTLSFTPVCMPVTTKQTVMGNGATGGHAMAGLWVLLAALLALVL